MLSLVNSSLPIIHFTLSVPNRMHPVRRRRLELRLRRLRGGQGFALSRNGAEKSNGGRVESLIDKGVSDGAKILLDGGNGSAGGPGNFLKPRLLDGVPASSALSTTETFGPVLSLVHASTLETGIEILSQSP